MTFYFLLFSTLSIISCICTVASKNSITSVLYLICVYVLCALNLLLLGAEFLSIIIVIIYIGAIAILFLFVIMMLNLRIVEVYNSLVSYFPIGSFLGIFFFLLFLFMIKADFQLFAINYNTNNLLELGILSNELLWSYSNLFLLGDVLYNSYSYLLVIAGLILLLAMIGSMALTLDSHYHAVEVRKKENFTSTRHLRNHITFWSPSQKK